MILSFADLAQNLFGMLAEPWRWALRRHRRAVERDRRAHARNFAVGGCRARPLDLHAAIHDLRIGKHLREVVDRARRHADRLELVQKLVARQARGQRAEVSDELGAVREPRLVVDVFFFLGERGLAKPAHSLANCPSLPEAMMMWPSAAGNT